LSQQAVSAQKIKDQKEFLWLWQKGKSLRHKIAAKQKSNYFGRKYNQFLLMKTVNIIYIAFDLF